MALVLADRVKETTTTTGTGTYTLAGAVAGFEPFTTIGNGNTTYYACTLGSDFEVGIGTYTASGTTLARTTILQSSNNDNAVNWGVGEKTIFCTQPAEKAVFLDASGNVAISRDTDASAEIGRAHIGNVNHGDFAGFSHVDQDSQTTYALLQQSDGHTYLNAASGQEISFRINNTDVMNMTSTGLDITGTLTVDPATAGGAGHKFSEWGSSNTDIDGLLPGSTFGSLYQGFPNGHMVIALQENDSQDSVAIMSGGGNFSSDTTYDTLIARFRANGDTHLNKVIATELDISGNVDVDGTLEADTMTLNGTAITSTATLSTGISNNNVPKFTSGVADNDFLRVDGTSIEGRSASEVLSDIGGQASLTFGISNTNAVKIDSTSVADDEYARFTANGLESRSTSEVLSDIGGITASSTDTLTNKTLTTPVINGFSGTGDGTITGDLTLNSTDGGSAVDPFLKILRNSSSPANQDVLGGLSFQGKNNNSEFINYAFVQSRIRDVTDGSENGALETFVETDGSLDLYTVHQDGQSQFYKDVAIISSDAGATENPTLDLYRNSASPADDDVIGHINFSGENSAGEKITYAEIQTSIADVTDGTEDSRLQLGARHNGTFLTYYEAKFGLNTFNRDAIFTNDTGIIFEGATNDGNETTLNVTDPTADRTITLPDQSGEVILVESREVEIDGNINIISTSAGSEQNPYFTFFRNSASPADGDNLGIFQFKGKNDAAEDVIYGRITARLSDATDGTEDGTFEIGTRSNGTIGTNIRVDASSTVGIRLLNGGERNIRFDTGTAFNGSHIDLAPASATGARTVTLPDATGTVSLLTNTETLTNKTLTTPVINGFSGTGDGSLTGNLSITNTSDNGPTLSLISDDPSDVADFNTEGHIKFFAENDASQSVEYANIEMVTRDVSDGSEDGRLEININEGGTVTRSFIFDHDRFYITNAQQIHWLDWSSTNDYILRPTTTISGDRTVTLPDASGEVLLTDGSGASLTSLNASQLTSGTVPNARLDAQLQDVAGLAVTNGGFIVGDGSNFVLETGSTARASLELGTAAVLDTGISNTNIPKFTSGVADNDFLRVDGTAIEGRSASEVLSDIGAQASLTFGISNTNAVKIDSTSVADNEFARFTANGLESRSTSEVLSDIGAITASSTDTLTNKTINASQLSGTIADARLSSAVLTTSNSDAPATTTSSSDADFILVDDGGTMKKITPANLGISANQDYGLITSSTASSQDYGAIT